MSNTARDIFIVGLRNAHAMEIQARELMERQSERLDEYPEIKSKVVAHLDETNQQLKRLEQCLEGCSESTSSLKDTAQSFAANMQAMAHSMAGDEILKNTFANDAFEHFESRPTNRFWPCVGRPARMQRGYPSYNRCRKSSRWRSGSSPMSKR